MPVVQLLPCHDQLAPSTSGPQEYYSVAESGIDHEGWAILRYQGAPDADPVSDRTSCTGTSYGLSRTILGSDHHPCQFLPPLKYRLSSHTSGVVCACIRVALSTAAAPCSVLNCPFAIFPPAMNLTCAPIDVLRNYNDSDPAPNSVCRVTTIARSLRAHACSPHGRQCLTSATVRYGVIVPCTIGRGAGAVPEPGVLPTGHQSPSLHDACGTAADAVQRRRHHPLRR
jgi:hypothetical protein